MVTKPLRTPLKCSFRSVLAKIHMVTKHAANGGHKPSGSVLAKIHMVTKQFVDILKYKDSSVLAKIHMVTKLVVV